VGGHETPEGLPGLQAELLDAARRVGPALEHLDVTAAPRGEKFVVLLRDDLGRGLGFAQLAEQSVQLTAATLGQTGQAHPWMHRMLRARIRPRRNQQIELSERVHQLVNLGHRHVY
jgi:hypothetical protein